MTAHLYQHLLYEHLCNSVLVKFLQGDAELLHRVSSFAGNVSSDANALRFDLPSLFEFTCQEYEREHGLPCETGRPAYLRFRKYLYEQPTNTRLREHGGEVTIALAHERHDRRLYTLARKARRET